MFSTAPVSGQAEGHCDRCNAKIQSADGFLFYSACSFDLPGRGHLLGPILYCAGCTDRLFGPEHWQRTAAASAEDRLRELAERPPVRADVPLRYHIVAFFFKGENLVKDDSAPINAAIDEAYADSVVAQCRQLGLTPEAARAAANRLAQEVWQVAAMPDPYRTGGQVQLAQKAAFHQALSQAEAFWLACDPPASPGLVACYYCGQRGGALGKPHQIVDERVLNRRVSDHMTAYTVQRRSLTISRCAECEKRHGRSRQLNTHIALYGVVGICAAVFLLMTLLMMLFPDKADPGLQTFRAVCGVVCAVALVVCGGLTAAGVIELRRVDAGIKAEDRWKRHPAVLAMQRHPGPLNLYGPNVIRSEI